MVDRLGKRFGITRVCVVADRGMISADTVVALEERGLEYILGVRERSDKLVRELVPRVRAQLKERLPEHMVPTSFVVLDALPRNASVEMDGILEAAAIGVPDKKSGEVVKVFAVRTDDSITEQDVIDFCRENLTGYKRPKIVEFRNELPKTNVGKILRRALRDE